MRHQPPPKAHASPTRPDTASHLTCGKADNHGKADSHPTPKKVAFRGPDGVLQSASWAGWGSQVDSAPETPHSHGPLAPGPTVTHPTTPPGVFDFIMFLETAVDAYSPGGSRSPTDCLARPPPTCTPCDLTSKDHNRRRLRNHT